MKITPGELHLLISEALTTQKLYHGSSQPLKVGSTLVARQRPTEFSDRADDVGTNVEKFVDSFRPADVPSRLQCIFAVGATRDLNLAGAAEDYVYVIESLGPVTKCDFGWFGEVLGLTHDGVELKKSDEAARCAKAYWSGKRFDVVSEDGHVTPSAFEYLCPAVKIIKRIRPR